MVPLLVPLVPLVPLLLVPMALWLVPRLQPMLIHIGRTTFMIVDGDLPPRIVVNASHLAVLAILDLAVTVTMPVAVAVSIVAVSVAVILREAQANSPGKGSDYQY